MPPLANPTRTSRPTYLGQRRHGPVGLRFLGVHGPVKQRAIRQINAPERTRCRALMEVTLVDRVAKTAGRRTLSFSEYSDYYHEAPGAKTLISGSVSDASPTVLDWEIGS